MSLVIDYCKFIKPSQYLYFVKHSFMRLIFQHLFLLNRNCQDLWICFLSVEIGNLQKMPI